MGLERGAWGVSAGLDYKPAYFATTDEVVRIVEAARPWRTHFTNHDRVTPESNFSSRAGIEETIAIGERAGLAPVITHMKAQGREQGTAASLVDLMRRATARGHFAAADVYPYLAGQTGLGALLIPAWAQDGGGEAMRKRFADPDQRARIVTEVEQAMDARFGGPRGVYLLAGGRELTDVMRELEVSAGEAVVRVLEKEGGGAILRFGVEPDLVTILQYPDAAIACDCGATTSTETHPRNYGTFPRVLGRYVRETGVLTWESAVRKMSGLPANILGLVDRGFLAPGMVADITVFDPAVIIDRATYERPAELSTGIRHVLVNGRVALRDGQATGERAGAALVRTRDMPTRPVSTRSARRLSLRGTVTALSSPADPSDAPASVRVAMSVGQAAGARGLKGSFRLQDRRAGIEIRLEDSGLLQTGTSWGTFTGMGRLLPSREERPVTVILDGAPRSGATLIVDVAGRYRFTGTLPVAGRTATVR
jgi:N-acyl-D-aspartate/D-glutamate deacylase